jgi:hypothetical protein
MMTGICSLTAGVQRSAGRNSQKPEYPHKKKNRKTESISKKNPGLVTVNQVFKRTF